MTTVAEAAPDNNDHMPSLERVTPDTVNSAHNTAPHPHSVHVIDLLDNDGPAVESNNLTNADYQHTNDELEVLSVTVQPKPRTNKRKLEQINILQQIIDAISANTVQHSHTSDDSAQQDRIDTLNNAADTESLDSSQQQSIADAIRNAVLAADRTMQQQQAKRMAPVVASVDLSADTAPEPVKLLPPLPNPVPESREDIVDALRRNISCPVCLEKNLDKIVSTTCGHIFCEKCIKLCVRLHRKCAKCNTRLTPKDLHQVYF